MEGNLGFTSSRRHFSREFRVQLLKEHQEKGVPISVLARSHGIHPITVYQWRRKMAQDNQGNDDLNPAQIKTLLQELQALKKENTTLKTKVADLVVSQEILEVALDIAKKKALLKQAQLAEKSKSSKNSK